MLQQGMGLTKELLGRASFVRTTPPTTTKHQNQPIKQKERRKLEKPPTSIKKKNKSVTQTQKLPTNRPCFTSKRCQGKAFQPYPRRLDPRGVQRFPRPATPSSRYSRETNQPIPFPCSDPGAKGDWQASSLPPGGKQQILGTQYLLRAETSVG